MERLEEKSVYGVVATASWGQDAGGASVGLKPTGLDVSFADGRILHYDLEGRLERVATPNVQWRRGLSNRMVVLRKPPPGTRGGLSVETLNDRNRDEVIEEASRRLTEVAHAIESGAYSLERTPPLSDRGQQELADMVARAARFDAVAARQDQDRFHAVYGDIPILPPDQYRAMVLLATDGCAYNRCTFCGFYRDVPFRRRSPAEFRQHVLEACDFHGRAMAARRNVFLGQANAMMGPVEWRLEILEQLQEHFRFVENDSPLTRTPNWIGEERKMRFVASFLDAFTGVRISESEFARMRELHLDTFYLGMETGDDELLRWLNKPATSEQMLQTTRAIKRAGIRVGVIILLGAGGERFFEQHLHHSVEMLNALPLSKGDYIYLSPLVPWAHTEYLEKARGEGVESLTEERLVEQERQIRSGLTSQPSSGGPYVARYDVSHFVY